MWHFYESYIKNKKEPCLVEKYKKKPNKVNFIEINNSKKHIYMQELSFYYTSFQSSICYKIQALIIIL